MIANNFFQDVAYLKYIETAVIYKNCTTFKALKAVSGKITVF
jgi:hypothetical protein